MSQYPVDQSPPPKKSPWPWIIGLGCGIPTVLIGGCITVVGVGAHRVINDPTFRKTLTQMTHNDADIKVMKKPGSKIESAKNDSGFLEVKGSLVNKTDTPITYLQVKVIGHDKSGAAAGVGIANTANLAPHGTWDYDVTLTNKEAVTSGDPIVSTSPIAD